MNNKILGFEDVKENRLFLDNKKWLCQKVGDTLINKKYWIEKNS